MTTFARRDSSVTPWYHQFWPWFIIALPATVVVASVITMIIAFKNADSLVNDNYYRDGLAINQVFSQDVRATELGLSARLELDPVTGELFVDLKGSIQLPATLQVQFLHPANEQQDFTVTARLTSDNRYRADLERLPAQRYYLRVQPAADADWRLNGEQDFSVRAGATLVAND